MVQEVDRDHTGNEGKLDSLTSEAFCLITKALLNTERFGSYKLSNVFCFRFLYEVQQNNFIWYITEYDLHLQIKELWLREVEGFAQGTEQVHRNQKSNSAINAKAPSVLLFPLGNRLICFAQ